MIVQIANKTGFCCSIEMLISNNKDKNIPIIISAQVFDKKIKRENKNLYTHFTLNKVVTIKVNTNEPNKTSCDSAKNKFVFKNWKTVKTTHKETKTILLKLVL